MARAGIPVVATAMQPRLCVAAIDFGTTYSGYAVSFHSHFEQDPLKIVSNQWHSGAGRPSSLKTSSCILFRPDQSFHSFGYEAEDQYATLAMEEQHQNWFFFKRFKMLLYANKVCIIEIKKKLIRPYLFFFFNFNVIFCRPEFNSMVLSISNLDLNLSVSTYYFTISI